MAKNTIFFIVIPSVYIVKEFGINPIKLDNGEVAARHLTHTIYFCAVPEDGDWLTMIKDLLGDNPMDKRKL